MHLLIKNTIVKTFYAINYYFKILKTSRIKKYKRTEFIWLKITGSYIQYGV